MKNQLLKIASCFINSCSKELFLTTVLLCFSAYAMAQALKTYTIEAAPFKTENGMTFAHYHLNLNLPNLQRVRENADLLIAISFQKGIVVENKIKTAGNYYALSFLTPSYKVSLYDNRRGLISAKNYGGILKNTSFGLENNKLKKDLATLWTEKGKAFLRTLEFQNLSFKEAEADIPKVIAQYEKKKLDSTSVDNDKGETENIVNISTNTPQVKSTNALSSNNNTKEKPNRRMNQAII